MTTPLASFRCSPARARAWLVALLAVAIASAAGTAAAAATPRGGPAVRGQDGSYDARERLATIVRNNPRASGFPRASARERDARRALARRLGSGAWLKIDPLTDTVASLQRLDGALTAPASGAPAMVARDYLTRNATALGLTGPDVAGLRVAGQLRGADGLAVVRFRQSVDGIPAFDSGVRVALDRGNRVLAVNGSPPSGLAGVDTTPRLGPADARKRLVDATGTRFAAAAVASRASDARQETRFTNGDSARLVIFSGRDPHLAWHLVATQDSTHVWDAVVDAQTGELLYRANLVKSAVAAQVFDNYPGAANGGTAVSVDLAPYLSSDTITDGPYVHAYADVNADDSAQSTEETDPDAGPYPFTPNAGGAGCDEFIPCAWDHTAAGSWSTNRDQSVIQAFWLANRFREHLSSTPIGFPGLEGTDRLQLEVLDGAAALDDNHINNANMLTLPAGQAAYMQLYLFTARTIQHGLPTPFRDIDAADDAALLFHEYAHGLSGRLVTFDDGSQALNTAQAAAMGEGWSDWYAQDYLVRAGLAADDPTVPGEVDMGRYTDAQAHALRYEPLDCGVDDTAAPCDNPTGLGGPGGFKFEDFATIAGRPEVHADGEIWAQTLWDLRTALIAAAGSQDDGSDLAETLITNAMRLSPPEPSFLDMRNAILAADTALGGLHRDLIWQVFARRGMGYFASADSSSDVSVIADDSLPPADGQTGTIAGRVTNADNGRPLAGVSVGIAGLGTDVGFADRLGATTGSDGHYTIAAVPEHLYPALQFRGAPGFDPVDLAEIDVTAGGVATEDVALRRNWAASAGGAKVATNDNVWADYGCGTLNALDQSPQTGWSAYTSAGTSSTRPNPHLGSPPTLTLKLPQTVDIARFGIDPTETCGDDANAATGAYRVETSPDGATWSTALQGSFAGGDRGRLNLMAPAAGAKSVRYVRLTLLSSQSATGDGQWFTDLTEFSVYGNAVPAGSITGGPATPAAGQTVSLDASNFTDADQDAIASYEWDFGDGTHAGGATVTHAYAAAGTFTPRVTVTDDRGATGTASATIAVSPAPQPPPATPPGDSGTPRRQQGPADPLIVLPRSGRRGVTFRVTCKDPCRVEAKLQVDNRTRRTARLRSGTLARLPRRPLLGARRFQVLVPKRLRTQLRNARRSRLKAVLVVTVRVTGGPKKVARRTVDLRV